MTSRFASTLIVATCVAAFASGCHVTSMKFRKSQNTAPLQTPYESGQPAIPMGAPPTYESPPSPLSLPPAPAPASSSKRDERGVKTSAVFRSMGHTMQRAFDRV